MCQLLITAASVKARSRVHRRGRHFSASELASLNVILAKRIEINDRSDFIPLKLNKFDYKQFKNLLVC